MEERLPGEVVGLYLVVAGDDQPELRRGRELVSFVAGACDEPRKANGSSNFRRAFL